MDAAMHGPRPARAAGDAPPSADSIIAWLLEEERVSADRTPALLERFARRLSDAGLPLDRATLHIQQLHPQLAARSLIWESAADETVELDYEYSVRNFAAYQASPVKPIYEGGASIRRRLEDPACPLDFPILEELKAQDFSDYGIYPIAFSGGVTNAISIATRRPGGFDGLAVPLLHEVLPAFASVLELRQLRRTARELLSTYVGPNTGERILSGAIRRGDGEVIHAVLWHCDLRGFTRRSETEPLDEVIALLNAYFDCMAGPVEARGGEILKFIGDAMLAIFPCQPSREAVCGAAEAAVAAAKEAIAALGQLNRERAARGREPIRCGVAVHLGEVMYGNVGAAGRLDFTVIGPAVNLVARLQPLCARLERPVLVTEEIARAARGRFRSLGRHALRGVAEPRAIFAPA